MSIETIYVAIATTGTVGTFTTVAVAKLTVTDLLAQASLPPELSVFAPYGVAGITIWILFSLLKEANRERQEALKAAQAMQEANSRLVGEAIVRLADSQQEISEAIRELGDKENDRG
jgi:hypothetical protein